MSRIKFYKLVHKVVELKTVKEILRFLNHYIIGLFKRIDEHNLFFAGAGISFSLFLGMIPFILLVFSILGNIVEQSTIELQLSNLIEQIIPYPSFAAYVKKLIVSRLPEVIEYKNLAGYIGIFGLMFTSTWIFSSLRMILNQIFKAKVERGYFYGIFKDLVMVVLLLLFIMIFTFIIPALNVLSDLTNNFRLLKIYELGSVLNIIFYFSSLIVMFSIFFGLYYLIPYEKLGKKIPAVSALWSTVLWEIARSIFGYYVYNILGTSPFYGAFVLIVAVLGWVFYSSCLFIVGAEIGQLYRERLIEKENYELQLK